jgi:tetratricopeptide (TPR) repeat protein
MALAGLLAFVAGLCIGPVQETDLFFRLAAGEQLLRTGHIVHNNLFSFTYPATPYLDPAWLFDLTVAALYRLGGFPAIVLAKTAVVIGLAAAAYWLCRRRGASRFATVLVLALAFACMHERLVERPHVLSLVGELALFALLPAIASGARWVWMLPVLVAGWANLHAGAFLAVPILLLAGLGSVLDRLPPRAGGRYALAASLSALALLATPVAFGIVRYLGFHADIFAIHPVDEFRSVTWRSDASFIVFATGCAGTLWLSAPRVWRDILPAFGLAVLAVWHVRFAADAALLLALAAAPALSQRLARFDRVRFATPALALVLLAVATAPRIARAARGGHALDMGLDQTALPRSAIDFVEEHGLRERMYNDFETGAYLLWQGYPRYRVFTDPRLPAYPEEFHRLLGRMHPTRAEWTRAMDALGVQSALLDYAGINRRVAFWDPEAWALVFRESNSRVFVRRLPKWNALIAKLEIPASFDFSVEEGARTLPLTKQPASSRVTPCEWDVRLGDLFFDLDGGKSERAIAAYRRALDAPTGCLPPAHELTAAAWLGALDVAAGRYDEALPLLERALALAPSDASLLTNRALALSALGRSSEARATWLQVARISPGTELAKRAEERARP